MVFFQPSVDLCLKLRDGHRTREIVQALPLKRPDHALHAGLVLISFYLGIYLMECPICFLDLTGSNNGAINFWNKSKVQLYFCSNIY